MPPPKPLGAEIALHRQPVVGGDDDEPADESRCATCGGSGFALNDRGAYPCPKCNTRADVLALNRLVDVPRRFRDCTVANYTPTVAGQFDARAEVARWVKEFQPRGQGLMLLGPVGTGKTHLASGALMAVAQLRHVACMWLSMPDWLASLRAAVGAGSGVEDMIETAIDAQLLLLDDIGAERLTDFGADAVGRVLGGRYNAMRPTVVTANLDDAGLAGHVGDRIASRLRESCRTVLVPGGDYRARKAPAGVVAGRAVAA